MREDLELVEVGGYGADHPARDPCRAYRRDPAIGGDALGELGMTELLTRQLGAELAGDGLGSTHATDDGPSGVECQRLAQHVGKNGETLRRFIAWFAWRLYRRRYEPVRQPVHSRGSRRSAGRDGRQGLTTRAFAKQLHTYDTWIHRRVSVKADVAMTIDDLSRMADGLGRPIDQFLAPYLAAQRAADRYGEEIQRASRQVNRYAMRDLNPQPADYGKPARRLVAEPVAAAA